MALVQYVFGFGLGVIAFLLTKWATQQLEAPQTTRRNGRAQRSDGPHSSSNINDEGNYFTEPGETCSICQEELSNSSMRYAPCGHAFHDNCYAKLTNIHKTCPLCRCELK